MPRCQGAPALPAAAHVFVDEISPCGTDLVELETRDAHHLADVMRLREGEIVTASDGRGSWRRFIYRAGAPAPTRSREPVRYAAALEVAGPVVFVQAPQPPVTVGFSLLKGDRNEWVVQKLTELGVDRIVPLVARRTIVRWDDVKSSRQMKRLASVMRDAAMQSRRAWLPKLDEPEHVTAAAEMMSCRGGGVAMLERGGGPLSLDAPSVLVGPEGGWSPEEIELALPLVAAGDGVLRAETAAISAASILCGLRAQIIALDPPSPAARVPL